MRVPCWAKRRAVASPMPLAPPVIVATLPCILLLGTAEESVIVNHTIEMGRAIMSYELLLLLLLFLLFLVHNRLIMFLVHKVSVQQRFFLKKNIRTNCERNITLRHVLSIDCKSIKKSKRLVLLS
jgi:hypothetical protein